MPTLSKADERAKIGATEAGDSVAGLLCALRNSWGHVV